MKKYKICMLGAFAVGKTSLVQQYVHSIFSEKYQTTLGVKIDKKSIEMDDQSIELILWDLAGEDEFMAVRDSYLRGSSGAILVADGTRAETLDICMGLKDKLYLEVGEVPVVLVVNKSDLGDSWNIDRDQLQQLRDSGWTVFETSARNSSNVDDAYRAISSKLIAAT